jgi:hypothetical protein
MNSALSAFMMASLTVTSLKAAEAKPSAYQIAVQDCTKSLSDAKEEATRCLENFKKPKYAGNMPTEADMDYLPVIRDYRPQQIKTYCSQPKQMKAQAARINSALDKNPIFLWPIQARL